MPRHRLHPEPRGEALEERFGQRDFGQQDQRLPAHPDRLGDPLQIDFGLARTGDAIEQERLEFSGRGRGLQDAGGIGLVGGQHRRREIGVGIGIRRIEIDLDPLDRPGLY